MSGGAQSYAQVASLPVLTLSNGVRLPAIGLVVFQSSPQDTVSAVRAALDAGYRHIDTAAAYGNERQVGQALRESGLPREEVVVETKVWASDYGHDETLHAFEKATGKLGLDTVDILILHQPIPLHFERTIAAYQALERLYADGKVRAIGVSNFSETHLTRLMEATEVVPALNQVELHPYFTQVGLRRFHEEHSILTQAWSPVGGITFYPGWGDENCRSVMDDPVLQAIASQTGTSAAQMVLRWHLQQGRSAIPKSVNPQRIAASIDILDFELSAEQVGQIDALDLGVRSGPDPQSTDPDTMDFTIPEA
ncbi:MAG: aldo/keto reductase [Actinomycetia bacterium]|nr:aldo/keto reductase [Actinomycetes bacterium]